MSDYDDFPNLVDGATPVSTGTAIDEAFWNLVQAALLGELRGATDPTRTAAQCIDEVLAARVGSQSGRTFSSLLARLNDWEARQYVQPSAIRNGFVLGNLLANDVGMMWSRGDAAAPDFWVLSGTGAAVARTGEGQADTTSVNSRLTSFASKVTYGSSAAALSQFVFPTALENALDEFFASKFVPVDATGTNLPGYTTDDSALQMYFIDHVWSDGSSRARIRLTGSSPVTSPYHPGDSTWRTLVAGPLNAVAGTPVQAQRRVEASGAAYFQSGCVIMAPLGLPPMYVPTPIVRDVHYVRVLGNPAGGTLDFFMPHEPIFILGAQMACVTAPTTNPPTIDLLTPIGGAFASLFVTLPTIATGKLVGTLQACDPAAANYRRRTIRGLPTVAAAALQDNSMLKMVYVDDTGNTLQDLVVAVHYLRYARPLDQFRELGDIGEA